MLCNFSCFCYCLLTSFKINFFEKIILGTHSRVSNFLDPDKDRHSVGTDLDPNCLLVYQQMTKVVTSEERVNSTDLRRIL